LNLSGTEPRPLAREFVLQFVGLGTSIRLRGVCGECGGGPGGGGFFDPRE